LDKPEVAGTRQSAISTGKRPFFADFLPGNRDSWIVAECEHGHSRKCDSTARFWWEKSHLRSFDVIKNQVCFGVVPWVRLRETEGGFVECCQGLPHTTIEAREIPGISV